MIRQYMLLDSQLSLKFKLLGKERNNTHLAVYHPPYVQPFLACGCGDQSSKHRENQPQIEV